ncbi:NADP-dependent oxidoreductase [Streptomyces longwoodensis]|uniref:NADP-dependent oxidoreductase n=1 Tax=Streptomyces longwoodensis TaxID=68231 RepID=UPI00369F4F1F
MKGISYNQYGGPEVLTYGEVRDPKVGPDAVLVKVRAASVNPVDWKARQGYLDGMLEAVFPVVPGWDVSGVVVQPGVSVTEYAAGDEVIGYVREDFLSRGTFAEYVAAPVRTLARKPRSLSFEEAAGLPLAGLTAYQVLTGALQVGRGDTVLVHAAAGGVGSMAVQLAHHLGARVIGTASERNHDFVRSLGGEPVAYGDGLADRVRGLAPEGVDAAFDTVGGDALKASVNLLTPEGRLASIADGDVVGYGGRYVWVRPDAEDLARLSDLADRGVVAVPVAETFPLERAADAYRLSEEGHARGKIVVTVDREDPAPEPGTTGATGY